MDLRTIGCLGLVAIPLIGAPIYLTAYWGTETQYTFTVESKGRECSSAGETVSCSNFVYGEDGQVFQNSDDIFYWKFDSRTVQSQIKEGETVTVTAVGWRVPFLSMQPNIISVRPSQ